MNEVTATAAEFEDHLTGLEAFVDRLEGLKRRHADLEPAKKDEDGYDVELSGRWVALAFILEPSLESILAVTPMFLLSPDGLKAGNLAADALEGLFTRFGF